MLSRRHQRKSPPHQSFAEIVRVSTARPPTICQEIVSSLWIALMSQQLVVGASFNPEADQENKQTDSITDADCISTGGSHDKQERQADQAHQGSLKAEDGEEASGPPASPGRLPPASIASVLTFQPMPKMNMQGKPQAPQADESRQQHASPARAFMKSKDGNTKKNEARTPELIGYTAIPFDKA